MISKRFSKRWTLASCLYLVLFIPTFLFFYGCKDAGREQQRSSSTSQEIQASQQDNRAKQWESWLRIHKEVGYDVLSAAASEAWIEKHKDEIRIPDQIEFGKPHLVRELPFVSYMIQIAVDPNGKRHVVAFELPPEKHTFQPEKYGYLNETESKRWLSDNGYQIEKTDSGYKLKSDYTRSGEGINVSSRVNKSIAQGATIIGEALGEDAVFLYIQDKFYIKPIASKD